MGINATVVYDVATHSTLVLRTSSSSTKNRYDVIDTVASFAQHCESLRGVATTVTEVSALWGGPPFVTYNVVNSRFRVMIIWNEDPAEFDVAYDVDNALNRLQNSVSKFADGLEHHSEDAIANVYDAAGYALRGDYPVTLNEQGSEQKKSRQKSSQPASSATRRSSFLDPRRKKNAGSASAGGGLFGKIGNVFKKAAGNDNDNSDRSQKLPPSSPASISSLANESKRGSSSAAPFGTDAAMDTTIGELELPDDMFTWANFGGPLPENDGDLRWFFSLAQGERNTQRRPRPPVLREGSAPSTPLTIPSSESPLGGTSSGPSSILPPAEPTPTQRETLTLGAPPIATANSAAVLSPSSAQVSTSEQVNVDSSSLPSSNNVAQMTKTSLTTSVQVQTGVSSQAPSQTGLPNNGTQSIGVNQTQSVKSYASSHVSNYSSMASSPQVGTPISLSGNPRNVNSIQGQRVEAGLGAVGSSGAIPPPPSLATPSHASSNSVTPQLPLSVMADVQQTNHRLPPAIAALKNESNFDVNNFGNLKDQASHQNIHQGGAANGNVQPQTGDDIIRAQMNQFARTMQSGNFELALQQVQSTLKYLSTTQPRRDREIITCSNYVLAQKILMRNNALDKELNSIPGGTQDAVLRHVECALLTMFLAELKHLLPRHRVAAMKIAVEKNSIVGNFGMCARWLRILVEKAPPTQKGEFSKRLQLCIQNGERNSHMPPTNRLCYNSLKVVTIPYGKCETCGAVYHAQLGGVTKGQVCSTCLVGRIELATQ